MSGLIIQPLAAPRAPILGEWQEITERVAALPNRNTRVFRHPSGILALSDTVVPDESEKPEYHVSVSFRGGVAGAEVMAYARHAFRLEDAQEDNHGPGVARHLWMACEEADRKPDCHCVNEVAPTIDGERVWRP